MERNQELAHDCHDPSHALMDAKAEIVALREELSRVWDALKVASEYAHDHCVLPWLCTPHCKNIRAIIAKKRAEL